MRRILLTGRSGQIGWELERCLGPLGEIVALDRRGMDLADPDSIRAGIRDVTPSLIINAAAYTAVDRAESEPELAMAINGIAPGIIAEEAKRLSAPVIHYSTDYVFDGKAERPYSENDSPNPVNVYGKTKLYGEEAIRQTGVDHLILRTSWLYGARGRNFLRRVLQMTSTGEVLRIVDDQVGSPTWSRLVADATARIIAADQHGADEELGCPSGTYHLSCEGQVSWFGFAKAIVQQFPDLIAHPSRGLHPRLEAIVSAQRSEGAIRPRYSVLSNQKIHNVASVKLLSWQTALQLCRDSLGSDGADANFLVGFRNSDVSEQEDRRDL